MHFFQIKGMHSDRRRDRCIAHMAEHQMRCSNRITTQHLAYFRGLSCRPRVLHWASTVYKTRCLPATSLASLSMLKCSYSVLRVASHASFPLVQAVPGAQHLTSFSGTFLRPPEV